VVANPEFMREGSAVKDFFSPSLVVVGGEDQVSVEKVASIYAPLQASVHNVNLRTAEMIKYACNAFHGVKIAFANEIGALSASLQIDAGSVLAMMCKDTKLNISSAYLKPGFAFGGSCISKDLRALTYRANQLNLSLPLLESTIPSNQRHLRRAIKAILGLSTSRLGFLGLAFKENTDDLRESPVVTLLETLIGKGRDVRVFDPTIQVDEIYGSNKNFLLQHIPHIHRVMDRTADLTISWADQLIVTQKLNKQLSEKVAASGLPVMDLTDSSLFYIREAACSTLRLELDEKSGVAVGSEW
jgi:GDP-mannose 6-dehydrogenase